MIRGSVESFSGVQKQFYNILLLVTSIQKVVDEINRLYIIVCLPGTDVEDHTNNTKDHILENYFRVGRFRRYVEV